jgi:hypothetical protein
MSVIMYNLVANFIGVESHFQQYVSYNVQCITWWPVLFVFNATFNNTSILMYNMETNFIDV